MPSCLSCYFWQGEGGGSLCHRRPLLHWCLPLYDPVSILYIKLLLHVCLRSSKSHLITFLKEIQDHLWSYSWLIIQLAFCSHIYWFFERFIQNLSCTLILFLPSPGSSQIHILLPYTYPTLGLISSFTHQFQIYWLCTLGYMVPSIVYTSSAASE